MPLLIATACALFNSTYLAGTVAHFVGPVPAVVVGGIGAVLVAVIWSQLFPGLRNQRTIDKRMA